MASNYIRKRSSSPYYQAYINVPHDLRDALGKRQFRLSLKTTSKKEAADLALPIVAEWKALFKSMRSDASTSTADKLHQLTTLLSSINKDMSTANADDKERLFHASSHYEDEVANLLGIDTFNAPVAAASDIAEFKIKTAQTTSFAGMFESYLKEIPSVKPTTVKIKRSVIQQFDDFVKKPVEHITRDDALAFQSHLLASGKKPSSIKTTIAHLKAYTSTMFPDRISVFNKITSKLPRQQKADERQAFTIAELNTLRAAISDSDEHILLPVFDIARYSGARISEICELKKSDVSLSDNTMTIRNSKSYSGDRTLPIALSLQPIIKQLMATSRSEYLIDISAGDKGRRSRIPAYRFANIRNALNMGEKLVFHSIRRTYATLAQQNGVSEFTAAALMGHKVGSTMSFSLYSSGASKSQMQEAVEIIATAIDKGST